MGESFGGTWSPRVSIPFRITIFAFSMNSQHSPFYAPSSLNALLDRCRVPLDRGEATVHRSWSPLED